MLLTLITNREDIAVMAVRSGIDRLLVDLEVRGKADRQRGRSLHLSDHRIEEVAAVARARPSAGVMVRIDAWHAESPGQIDAAIAAGATRIMLPFFQDEEAVHRCLGSVAGRVPVTPLVETPQALARIAVIAACDGVDEVHIGLNDLCLACGGRTIFDPLVDGRIAAAAEAVHGTGRRFGFGGLGRLDDPGLPVPPDLVLAEQIRLGCALAWLGRSFRDQITDGLQGWRREVARLRAAMDRWRAADAQTWVRQATDLAGAVRAWQDAVTV